MGKPQNTQNTQKQEKINHEFNELTRSGRNHGKALRAVRSSGFWVPSSGFWVGGYAAGLPGCFKR